MSATGESFEGHKLYVYYGKNSGVEVGCLWTKGLMHIKLRCFSHRNFKPDEQVVFVLTPHEACAAGYYLSTIASGLLLHRGPDGLDILSIIGNGNGSEREGNKRRYRLTLAARFSRHRGDQGGSVNTFKRLEVQVYESEAGKFAAALVFVKKVGNNTVNVNVPLTASQLFHMGELLRSVSVSASLLLENACVAGESIGENGVSKTATDERAAKEEVEEDGLDLEPVEEVSELEGVEDYEFESEF